MISPTVPYASPQVLARYSPYGETKFLALPALGNPADIADNGSNPVPDGVVDNGDFSLFISEFFNSTVQAGCNGTTVPCSPADIADNGSIVGADGYLDNGDFSLFISNFFAAANFENVPLSDRTLESPFWFSGYVYNPDLALYTVRHRTYAPSLGRWLSRDPAGYVDGSNLYEYVRSSPTLATDPMGLCVGGNCGRPVSYSYEATGSVRAAMTGLCLQQVAQSGPIGSGLIPCDGQAILAACLATQGPAQDRVRALYALFKSKTNPDGCTVSVNAGNCANPNNMGETLGQSITLCCNSCPQSQPAQLQCLCDTLAHELVHANVNCVRNRQSPSTCDEIGESELLAAIRSRQCCPGRYQRVLYPHLSYDACIRRIVRDSMVNKQNNLLALMCTLTEFDDFMRKLAPRIVERQRLNGEGERFCP
jgi:RHS repeat-associated protein